MSAPVNIWFPREIMKFIVGHTGTSSYLLDARSRGKRIRVFSRETLYYSTDLGILYFELRDAKTNAGASIRL